MNMDKIKEIGDGAKLLKDLFSTKDGVLALLFVVVIIAAGIIIWKDNQQISDLKDEKTEALKMVAASAEREAKIKDDCANTMRTYLDFYKELGLQFSNNVNNYQSIERQTRSVINQQNNLIYEATHE